MTGRQSRSERESFYRHNGLWTDQQLGWLATEGAIRWGDATFLVLGDRRVSYREFADLVDGTAAMLIDGGLKPGDRFLLQMTNSVELLVLLFACWRVGATPVPIVPLFRLHELRSICAEVQPAMIAVSHREDRRSLIAEVDELVAQSGLNLAAKLVIGGSADGWTPFSAEDAAGFPTADNLPPPCSAAECCLILYTSGSTAAPKGALLNGRAILSNARNHCTTHSLGQSVVTLAPSPLAHIAALCLGVINPMLVGGACVMMRSWAPDEAIALIEREKVTNWGGVFTFLQDLIERYEAGEGGTHRMSNCAVGGANIPFSLIERSDRIGIHATNQYGMTEIVGNATLSDPSASIDRRANFAGKIMFGTEVEAVDDQRMPLPPGNPGELRIRSPQMMLGYTDPAVSADLLDADGWFYTGDVGIVDADGWVRITGRIKDIINRGGEKFPAADIENALASHPDIDTAVVVGVPEQRFGEVVGACLRLKAGAAWNGPEDFLAHLEHLRLSRSKFPVIWRVVDDFPRSPSGKIVKNDLVPLFADG